MANFASVNRQSMSGHADLLGLLTVGPEWYWEQDCELKFTLVEGQGFAQTGLAPEMVLGRRCWELPGAMPLLNWEDHQSCLEKRQPFAGFIYRIRNTDGAQHFIRASGQPMFDERGVFSGYCGMASDVTEEMLHRRREQRLSALVSVFADWSWEQDQEFRIVAVDGRMEERCGIKPEFFVGKCHWELGVTNLLPEEWARHHALLEGRQPFHELELNIHTGNGDSRWVAISGQPVFAEDGGFAGYRGIGKEISERKQNEERIRYLATHDPLTSLPNRALFSEFLNRAIQSARRYDRRFAVVFIDLDRFKTINDSLGHEAGDTLLKTISLRLRECLRTSDVVARLGGDEFVVLLHEVEQVEDAAAAANKMLSAVIRPIMLLGQECRVTASLGIALFSGVEDEQALMKNADIAMYRAKEEGKNNFQFYSEDIKSQSLERMILENSLRRAVEFRQFFLHYQAQVDLKTGHIRGVEALIRWEHPELGVVPPMQFIPLAEETGLIIPIGRWVLNEACTQNVRWRKQGVPPILMAVNLSGRQFADDSLIDDIHHALAHSGMDPNLLVLELTESMVIHNFDHTNRVLLALKNLGVKIAIDDFGTGYSSLAQLKHFPIDTLKVDRSFIRDLPINAEDRAITRAIIDMGKSLSLTVVAEGVETDEQKEFLEQNFCDEIQGFHFSKPISPEDFVILCSKEGLMQKSLPD
ncbi:MAG: hypothetical protein K0S28_1465 [Paucimonas sp.]|nr:hypothetical protein [Paucimonas sp.]